MSVQALDTNEEIFDRRLRFPVHERNNSTVSDFNGADTDDEDDQGYREASLTHVLTNVVILQEFILELAAIIHVRAGLLANEVDFLGNVL